MISNSKNIDISILVPCYNSSSTIERCLDSIIDQEYNLKKIKIICINDGSTDNTLQILQKYKKKYDSIFEIYSQENEGLAKTRQNLLSHVTTTFFMFLDSDDFFLPKAFKRIVNASKNGKFIVTVSKSTRYFENKKKHRIWWLNSHIHKNMSGRSYLKLNQPFLWNILINTDYFRKTNIKWTPRLDFMEDNVCGTLLFANINRKKIGVCKYKTYAYCYNENSLSNSKTSKLKNISTALKQTECFLNDIKNINENKKDIDFFIKNFIYVVAMYFVCVYFIFPKFYKYEKPEKELWEDTKQKFMQILKEHNLTITKPKGYWRIISYYLCVKNKFKKVN